MHNRKWYDNPQTDLERALVDMIGHMTEVEYNRIGDYNALDAIADACLINDWYPEIHAVASEVYPLMDEWFHDPRGGALLCVRVSRDVVARLVTNQSLTLDEAIDLAGGDFDQDTGMYYLDGTPYDWTELEVVY